MGEIGEKIEAAITAAIQKHFKDDDVSWPLRVQVTIAVTISPELN